MCIRDRDDWDTVINVHLRGSFLMSRAAQKHMVAAKYGKILNLSSASALGNRGQANYSTAKMGLQGLTRTLARELAGFNITVNAVGPTPVKTDLTQSVPSGKLEALIARQAIHRYGEFRDIQNVIDFFIQAESDFITGQVIFLGGV